MALTPPKKRLDLGRPLLPSEHQFNWDNIEAFVNALDLKVSTALNPDGTVADGAVSTTEKLADAIITLAKWADLANTHAVIGSDGATPPRPKEITGNNGEYLRKNDTSDALEFGTLPSANAGVIRGAYQGSGNIYVPTFGVEVGLIISVEALLRVSSSNDTYVAALPVTINGIEQCACRWWVSEPNVGGHFSLAHSTCNSYRQAPADDTVIVLGSLTAEEGSTLPAGWSLSNVRTTCIAFGV